jgi:23S rRNA pseudouridine2605 synthase
MKKEKLITFLVSQTNYSRRELINLVLSKEVHVNGNPAKSGSQEVDLSKDRITVKLEVINKTVRYSYFKFNKPKDVICSLDDPKGRTDLSKFINELPANVFPVGRLDRNTKGLLLFTNNGNIANKICHPTYKLRKIYSIELNTRITKNQIQRLTSGLILEDGPVYFDSVEVLSNTNLKVTISEGRNRIIRRTFQLLGYQDIKLKRLAIGPIQLANLKEGYFKRLTKGEVQSLLDTCDG